MIRRKLTRIEVTLDDTKELDDFFNKTPQIGLQTSASVTTTTNSKLTGLFNQRQLFLLGKKYDFNQTNDSVVDSSARTSNTNNNASNTTTNTVIGDNNIAVSGNNLNEPEERLTFNPQPYNPSNRFNQDNL